MAKADNETLIIALLQSNDSSAIQQGVRLLTQLARPLAFQIALKNGGTQEDAEDLLQDGVVIVWQRVRDGKFSHQGEGSLRAYVHAVLRNLWMRELRKRKQQPPRGELPPEGGATEGDEGEEMDLGRLESILAQLDAECRQILEEYYLQKLDLKGIAQRLGKTYGAVKEQKYRCLLRLRALLKRP